MRAKLTGLLAAAGLLLMVAPALAHHPFAAEFDKDKPIHLTGTISKVDWTNPHSFLYVDAKDKEGHMANWTIELGGPNALKRRGWNQTSLKQGDQITVDGWQAKDGSHRGNAQTVMFPNGKEMNAASSFFDKPDAKNGNGH
jgi:hypothetical protein